ncbi:heavy-metal-associated domain-containing protein [Clostridium sp. CX1]|uniref:Heavy metal-associated domain-containing protein n=1 Tax=Clostridium tanneri TaxID=3037988 RepID=A0ABU4JP45_9CLOT|nr:MULTISPECIES: heavy metal-associated domain-containing protein [unclassified Clostridium]MCT8976167.1 heavy-metal-associated domain-containing protein [Clostridium sp. CX1]MDW8799731.1 heavy metal-associated domain-containing protein [Clostridium sp. A1-XYC3]
MKKILTIEGMSCMKCVRQVHDALVELPGVTSVNIDLRTETAFVESRTSIDDNKIKEAVDDTGYEVTDIEKI